MGSTNQPNGAKNGHSNGYGVPLVLGPTVVGQADDDDKGIDVVQIWNTVREGWRWVALITVVVFSAAVIMTLRSQMTFTLNASLYLGDVKGSGGIADALTTQLGMDKGDVSTEIEILRSRELTSRAVLASGLNTSVTPYGWTPSPYWRWRLDGRNMRRLQGALDEVRAVSTRLTGDGNSAKTADVVFITAHDYQVRSGPLIIGMGTLGKPLVIPGIEMTLVAGLEGEPHPGRRYIVRVMPLEPILEQVLTSLSAKAPKAGALGKEVNVVHLSLKTTSPFQGRMFLEELMRAYLDQNLAWKTEEAAAAEKFLTKQLENIGASGEKAGKELAEFKKSTNTIELTEEAKEAIGQMGTLEQQRVAARLQVEALEQVKAVLAKGNAPPEAYLLGEAQDTVLMAMSEALVKAQAEHKRLSEQFTPDYPLVREAQAALDSQLQTIRSYVKTRLARAHEQAAALDTAIDKYNEKLKGLPDAELKLATLTQKTDVYTKIYQYLLEHQQQAALTKASTISKSRVLDAPVLPSMETGPNLRARGAAGFMLGLLCGIGLVLVRRRLATTFQSESELRKELTSAPLFASIPRRPQDKKASSSKFEGIADPRSPFAEAFRLLRTNLYYSGSRDDDKVILVSSPGPGDGKTVTTLCLAGILAADGKRVLVVDGDLRKPSHHILLREPQQPGLSGVLTGQVHWRDVVQTVPTEYGQFSSITTGIVPPNPAELLSSKHLDKFLTEAKADFDFILLDSPPFPLVSDAFVLSQCAQRILSVVRIGVTRRRVAVEHIRHFAAATTRYGIVINGTPAGGAYGYGYGYGYGEYGYGSTAVPRKPKRRLWRRQKDSDETATRHQ